MRSPKTEHHEGKAERVIPIFPELRPYLEDVHYLADKGADAVITRYREGANINPQLHRIVKRAGLKAWPRIFHNLRASRQSEFTREYSLATVCAWIGNTKAVAAGHYLQVTDPDWLKAVGGGKTAGPARGPTGGPTVAPLAAPLANTVNHSDSQNESEVPVNCGFMSDRSNDCETVENREVGRAGLEPATPAFSMRCSTN